MIKTVTKKQYNSDGCFVCGLENEAGLACEFYELDDGSVIALATARDVHKSYPSVVHGGVSAALLDEAMGRAIYVSEPETTGITVELCTKYKKPVPSDVELRILGRITENSTRWFKGEGKILLPDGTVAVEATATFVKMSAEMRDVFGDGSYQMMTVDRPDDPKEFDLP